MDATDLSRLIPDCRVSLDGKRLDVPVDAALRRAEVHLDADLLGQCALHFVDRKLELIDGSLFSSGVRVKVELGFAARLQTVFEGEVVALEPRFVRDEPPSLKVICQEAMHRLALSPMTRAFNDADDRQVAQAIAQDHGLSCEAPEGSREHILQANVSDAAFLRLRAQQHGHRVSIEGTRLVIAPPAEEESGVTLRPGEGVRKVKVMVRAGQQVEAVSVHGWDPANRREIVGQVKAEGDAARHGAGTLSIAGDGTLPVDIATAESMARGRLRRITERMVTVEVEMIGDARLVPGRTFTLDKVDEKLDGTYRVDRATHAFDKHGYRLSLKAAQVKKKEPRASPRRLEAVAPQRHHLRARVVHQGTENAVNAASWEIRDSQDRVVRSGTTAANGLVMQEVPAGGRYTIRVLEYRNTRVERRRGRRPRPVAADFPITARQGSLADSNAIPQKLEVFADPPPLIWAKLFNQADTEPLGAVAYSIDAGGTTITGTAGADSIVRHEVSAAGWFTIRAGGLTGSIPARPGAWADAPARVRMRAQAAPRVNGLILVKLYDQSGATLLADTEYRIGHEDHWHPGKTDAEGVLRMEDVEPGFYTVRVGAGQATVPARRVENATAPLPVRMLGPIHYQGGDLGWEPAEPSDGSHTVWAELCDDAGNPLADHDYTLEGEGATLTGRTDSEGKLRHQGLTPGFYQVRVGEHAATAPSVPETLARARRVLVPGHAPAAAEGEPDAGEPLAEC